MASVKKITMREYNGTDYDTLYPKTIASQVDGVYTKEESISASTRTALSLAQNATPDAAFAKIAQQLSNPTVSMKLLWQNASINSGFTAQTIALDLSLYDGVIINFTNSYVTIFVPKSAFGISLQVRVSDFMQDDFRRSLTVKATGVIFEDAKKIAYNSSSTSNDEIRPWHIYGIKGVS